MIPPIMFASFALNIQSFGSVEAGLLPLVFAALLVDAGIITIWYIFGYLLGNASVRQSARSEFYQLIGTGLLIAIIIGGMAVFSGFFQATLNNTALLNQKTISSLSANIIAEAGSSQTPITLLQSGGFSGLYDSIVNGNGPDPLTSQIDYPLAASGIVIENLTYQSITNLNDYFVVNSYIGFLSSLSPQFGICIDSIPETPQCLLPVPEPVDLFLSVSYTPYAGLSMVYASMASLGILMTTALYSFIMQLSFVSIFLFLWPYLIFVGLILRSNFLTRKLGGLFIAVAIGAVFFFPTIFAIQYLTLGNGFSNLATFGNVFSGPGSLSSIYGYNSLPTGSLTELPGNSCVSTPSGQQCGVYIPNFYVFPNVETVANSNQYNCWPPSGNTAGAFGAEAADIAFLWIPGTSNPFEALGGALVSGYPTIYLPYQCAPNDAVNLLFAFANMYGLYGVTGYLLPLLDVMITLAAIIGLSGLLGGDTSIFGLSKFV